MKYWCIFLGSSHWFLACGLTHWKTHSIITIIVMYTYVKCVYIILRIMPYFCANAPKTEMIFILLFTFHYDWNKKQYTRLFGTLVIRWYGEANSIYIACNTGLITNTGVTLNIRWHWALALKMINYVLT